MDQEVENVENIDNYVPTSQTVIPNLRIANNPSNLIVKWEDLNEPLKWVLSQPYIEPLSPYWFLKRLEGVTASEYGAICGVQPNFDKLPISPREKVFQLKTNQRPPDQDNENMMHGRKFEPIAGTIYSLRTNQVTFNVGLIQHPNIPFLLVTPDLLRINGTIAEIKCPRRRSIIPHMDYEMMQKILPYYYHQCQMQAFVTGLHDEIDFVQYGVSPNPHYLKQSSLTIHKLPYDHHWWAQNESETRNFWDLVLRYYYFGDTD